MTVLDQICLNIIDCEHKTAPIQDSGIPSIRTTDIKGGVIDFRGANKVSEETYKVWTERLEPQPHDLILAREAPVGEIGIIPKGQRACLGQRTVLIRPNPDKVYPHYLLYLMQSRGVQHEMQIRAAGSTVTHLNMCDIRELDLPDLPPLEVQCQIGDTLANLDRKIENLRKQNETLEAIAQTLFKHWFIDFEFPNEDRKPYKSSGGEMVQSELGEIPAGWRAIKLGVLVNTINGYSYKGTDLGESDIALVNLKNFDRNGGFRLDGFKEIITSNYHDRHLVEPNDLLVAHTDLTQNAEVLGNPILVQPLSKYSRYVLSMDLVKITSKNSKINNFYLYYLLSSRFFKQHCIGYANGTTVLHLNKSAIPEYKFSMPIDSSTIEDFQAVASGVRKRITNNLKQIQTLTKTRDVLLPQLMSGKLRITE
ncbi:restriction endonuclease subunit S [Microcoleus sp. B3-D7]|uniref:restriction endonuclease subunit S n=1 Tax=Microcoleus sp. B3-D7 TaxID=2818659 RepID=UPI002FD37756